MSEARKIGDVILKVDGVAVENARDVQKQVLTHAVGDNINLEVWRDGRTVALQAKSAELPGEDDGQGGGGEERNKAKSKLGLSLQPLTPQIAEQVIQEVAAERGIKLGPIVDAFDARIQGIVDNWPQQVDGSRAVEIGLPRPPELKVIVEQYVEDFGSKQA